MQIYIQKLLNGILGVLDSDVLGPNFGRTSGIPPTTKTSEVLRQEIEVCLQRWLIIGTRKKISRAPPPPRNWESFF